MHHHCHAIGCPAEVPPEKLMCGRHWGIVPKAIQRSVWESYRVGQCDDKRPSKAWHSAADAAIRFVAVSEGRSTVRPRSDTDTERSQKMALDPRAIANRMAKSRAAGGGNFIKPGKGRLMIQKILLSDQFKGATFIAELYVVSSQSYEDARDEKGAQVLANAPGSGCSLVLLLDKMEQTAYPNMKRFLMTLEGVEDEAEMTEEQHQELFLRAINPTDQFNPQGQLVMQKNPYRGALIDFETYEKRARDSGKLLILPKWHPVEQTLEQVQANRIWLDAQETQGTLPQVNVEEAVGAAAEAAA